MSLLLFMIMGLAMMATAAASFFFYFRAKQLEGQRQLPPGYAGQQFTPAGQLPGGQQAAHQIGGVDLMNIPLGSIVTHFATDYIVQGRMTHWEEGYTWLTYMLVDGDTVRWLGVEEDDMLEVSLWEEIKGLPVSVPPPEFLEYRGERFHMVEQGTARVTQQGKTGSKTGMQVDYYEYEGSGGENALSVEIWGGDVEVSFGKEINPAELDVLPGDLVEY